MRELDGHVQLFFALITVLVSEREEEGVGGVVVGEFLEIGSSTLVDVSRKKKNQDRISESRNRAQENTLRWQRQQRAVRQRIKSSL